MSKATVGDYQTLEEKKMLFRAHKAMVAAVVLTARLPESRRMRAAMNALDRAMDHTIALAERAGVDLTGGEPQAAHEASEPDADGFVTVTYKE